MIAQLRARVVAATGKERTEALTQWEQALNYERLVQLDDWWRQA